MPWLKRPDTEIFWQTAGLSDGKSILMLHGLGSPPELSFYTLWPELAQTHTLVLPSLRGQGKNLREGIANPVDEFSLTYPEKVVDDLGALLNHLSIDKTNILGYSLGGAIGIALAAKYPKQVDKLILLATGFHSNFDAIYAMALKMTHPGYLEHMPDTLEPWLRALIRYYGDRYQAMGEAEVLGIRHGIFEAWNEYIQELVPHVKSPTLIIHGSQDSIVPVKESAWLHDHLPQSTLRILSDGTHGLQNDNSKALHKIVAWINNFLK